MKPKFVLLLVLLSLFLISNCEAKSLGLSPSGKQVEFEECFNISVFSKDYSGLISVEDRWTNGAEFLSISNYYLSAEDVGVSLYYPNSFYLNNNKEIVVCVDFQKNNSLDSNGILIFRQLNGNAGIAFRVLISGKIKEYYEKPSFINAKLTFDNLKFPNSFQINLIWIFILQLIFILLLICLFYLIKKGLYRKDC